MEEPPVPRTLTHRELVTVMKKSDIAFTDMKNQQKVLKDFIFVTYGLEDKISEEESKELEKNLRFFLVCAVGLYEKV